MGGYHKGLCWGNFILDVITLYFSKSGFLFRIKFFLGHQSYPLLYNDKALEV